MRIGELARRTGLRASAIRYYEDVGLLSPPRRVSGRRVYEEGAYHRLLLIQAAQRAGFSLAEIRELVELTADQARAAAGWPVLAQGKLDELDASIAKLQHTRAALARALDCTCAGDPASCALVTFDQERRRDSESTSLDLAR